MINKDRCHYFEKWHRKIHTLLYKFGFSYNQTDKFAYRIIDILGIKD